MTLSSSVGEIGLCFLSWLMQQLIACCDQSKTNKNGAHVQKDN